MRVWNQVTLFETPGPMCEVYYNLYAEKLHYWLLQDDDEYYGKAIHLWLPTNWGWVDLGECC